MENAMNLQGLTVQKDRTNVAAPRRLELRAPIRRRQALPQRILRKSLDEDAVMRRLARQKRRNAKPKGWGRPEPSSGRNAGGFFRPLVIQRFPTFVEDGEIFAVGVDAAALLLCDPFHDPEFA